MLFLKKSIVLFIKKVTLVYEFRCNIFTSFKRIKL